MGFRLPNGSFTGSIGQVENGSADMSSNTRFLMYVGTKNCAYLDPVDVITLRYMVPKQNSTVIKLQYAVLQMFNFQVRCLFIIAFIIMIICWFFIDLASNVCYQESKLTLMDKIFFTISVLSYVTIPERKLKSNHDRMILIFLLMFAIIVCNIFQGAVMSYLSNPSRSTDINSLEELINSDLKLYALVVIKGNFVQSRKFIRLIFYITTMQIYSNPTQTNRM